MLNWSQEQIRPGLVFQLLRLLPEAAYLPRKKFVIFAESCGQSEGTIWISWVKEPFIGCVIWEGIWGVSCSGSKPFRNAMSTNLFLVAFKASFESDPSPEGQGSVLENKSLRPSFKFSYDSTSAESQRNSLYLFLFSSSSVWTIGKTVDTHAFIVERNPAWGNVCQSVLTCSMDQWKHLLQRCSPGNSRVELRVIFKSDLWLEH